MPYKYYDENISFNGSARYNGVPIWQPYPESMPTTFFLDPRHLRAIKYTDSPPISLATTLMPAADIAYAEERFGWMLMQTATGSDYEICEYRAQIRAATDFFPVVPTRTLTLLYVIKGSPGCHMKDEDRMLLKEGRYYVFLMPSSVKAIILAPGDYTVFHVSLSAHYYSILTRARAEIKSFAPDGAPSGPRVGNAGLTITTHVQTVIAEIYRGRGMFIDTDVFTRARIFDLLLLFSRETMQNGAINRPQPEGADRQTQLALRVRRILDGRGGHPIHMNELCRLLGTNHRALKMGFKQLYQKTIYAYQLELRMNIARDLLVQGRYSIHEISGLLEYKNPSSFIKKFKEMYEMTPLQYRKKNS